jgi:hypothetical protein
MGSLLKRLGAVALLGAVLIGQGAPVTAAGMLAPPQDEVLLTVSGAIAETNTEAGEAVFDRAMLEALDPVIIETSTIWTDGVQRFRGVPLVTLLDRLGAEGTILRALALNDYAIEIPVSDAVAGGPIIAFERNDEPMSVRDKGPLWVIYPYDAVPEYKSERIYARSIWQLVSIEVLP